MTPTLEIWPHCSSVRAMRITFALVSAQVRMRVDVNGDVEDVDVNYEQNYVKVNVTESDGEEALLLHHYGAVSTDTHAYPKYTHAQTHTHTHSIHTGTNLLKRQSSLHCVDIIFFPTKPCPKSLGYISEVLGFQTNWFIPSTISEMQTSASCTPTTRS